MQTPISRPSPASRTKRRSPSTTSSPQIPLPAFPSPSSSTLSTPGSANANRKGSSLNQPSIAGARKDPTSTTPPNDTIGTGSPIPSTKTNRNGRTSALSNVVSPSSRPSNNPNANRPSPAKRQSRSSTPNAVTSPPAKTTSTSTSSSTGSPEEDEPRGEDGILGGLKEKSEEELERAGKEELKIALKEEWAEKQRVQADLQALRTELESTQSNLSTTTRSLTSATTELTHLSATYSTTLVSLEEKTSFCDKFEGMVKGMMDERREREERVRGLEGEVEGLREEREDWERERERLKGTLGRVEEEMERREREHASEMQGRGVAGVVDLSESPSTTSMIHPSNLTSSNLTNGTSVQLQSLQSSHNQLYEDYTYIHTRHAELAQQITELKEMNERLQSENVGYEVILRERTLDGRMRFDTDDTDGNQDGSTPTMHSSAFLSPSTSGNSMDLGSGSQSGLGVSGLGGLKTGYMAKGASSVGRTSGKSLADELSGDGDGDQEGIEERLMELEGRIKILEGQNKHLTETNIGLRAYCSKILDRLASDGGLQHILSSEYDQQQRPSISRPIDVERPPILPTSSSSSLTTPSSRLTTTTPRMVSPSSIPTSGSTIGLLAPPGTQMPIAARGKVVDPRTGLRPLSMVISQEAKQQQAARESAATAAAAASEKRARRGLSMNFSSMFSSPPPVSISPNGLAANATSPSPGGFSSLAEEPDPMTATTSVPLPKIESPSARKLEAEEEDDEDRIERQRLQASLKLMGVSPQGVENDAGLPAMDRWGSFLETPPISESSRTSCSATSTTSQPPPPKRANSTLSRFSSIFSKSPVLSSPLSPEIEKLDPYAEVTPEIAQDALKAFDKREKQLMASHNVGGLTSPPEGGLRAMAEQRRLSRSSAGSRSPPGSVIADADPELPPTELGSEEIQAAWKASSKKNQSSITTLFEVEDPHD